MVIDGCISNRVGCHPRGEVRGQRMGTSPVVHPHKLPGTDGSTSGSKTLSPLHKGLPCLSQVRHNYSSSICQKTKGLTVPPVTQASTRTNHVEQ